MTDPGKPEFVGGMEPQRVGGKAAAEWKSLFESCCLSHQKVNSRLTLLEDMLCDKCTDDPPDRTVVPCIQCEAQKWKAEAERLRWELMKTLGRETDSILQELKEEDQLRAIARELAEALKKVLVFMHNEIQYHQTCKELDGYCDNHLTYFAAKEALVHAEEAGL